MTAVHTAVVATRKQIQVSLYEDDLKSARKKVRVLQRRGYKKMSFSRLVRIALRRLNLDDISPPDTDLQ